MQTYGLTQGFKNNCDCVKVFAILIGTGVTKLIADIVVWNNYNFFFIIENGDNGIGICIFQNSFFADRFWKLSFYSFL